MKMRHGIQPHDLVEHRCRKALLRSSKIRSGDAHRGAACPTQCGYVEETRRTLIAQLTETLDGKSRDTGGDPADSFVDQFVATGANYNRLDRI